MEEEKKKTTIADLNTLYDESERIDKKCFAEMRSNVLLCAGDHYNRKRENATYPNIRSSSRGVQSKRLRLTKNHIYRIVKTYANAITAKAPGVVPLPKNEAEMQDKKSAELNKAVWQDIKDRHKLNAKFARYAHEFVEVGEHAVKITWDQDKGEIVGYRPLMDELGEPVMQQAVGEDGQPSFDIQEGIEESTDEFGMPIQIPVQTQVPRMENVPDKSQPVYSGDFSFDTIHAFDLLRDPAVGDMRESKYLIVRTMPDRKELKRRYKDQPDKLKFLEKSDGETFVVFDSNTGKHERTKSKVLVKEAYYRPCPEYPEGYFYFYTDHGILEQGPLPYSLFPIKWVGFDEAPTSARASSIIRVARPYQGEINRAASQEATHQIVNGDDKIIYQAGATLTQGAQLPGIRGLSVNGTAPTVLPGRAGAQFTEYIERQKSEMYQAVFLDEVFAEKSAQLDPYSMLFRSMSQQAIFVPYVKKFEEYLVEICELTLRMAKHYLPDDSVIRAVGKDETVNIEEFRNTEEMSYQIKVEAMSDSIETMMGKQITFQHVLQYVGKDMDKKTVGKVLKNMPFLNNEDTFSELTIDEDNVDNDMLLIERGGQPQIDIYDNNEYYIKKLVHRIKSPSFALLSPEVQQVYQQFLQMHQQEEMRKVQEMKAAQDEMIPTGGAMVTCQIHVQDPENPGSTKQLRLPYETLMDTVSKLEKQGKTLQVLEDMNQGVVAQMAQQMSAQNSPGANQQINNPGLNAQVAQPI